jgi:hypothetical protein
MGNRYDGMAPNDFGFVFSACASSISIDIGLHWEG